METINKLDFPKGLPVGYCFSYPATSLFNGDAELLKWVKGVNIKDMEGNAVGKPLIDYLNKNSDSNFSKVTVVNDTITSLFSGLKNTNFDAYVGLIVGTGTNMATFLPSENIPKLNEIKNWKGKTPVNLETGNFFPPHLTATDDVVDYRLDNPGMQRFEKAVSGMYLGRIFKAAFPNEHFADEMDAERLTYIINHPDEYKNDYVEVASQIYERSASLVAASLAGIIKSLHEVDSSTKHIQIVAEGSLFWSTVNEEKLSYSVVVKTCLNELLKKLDMGEKDVVISKIENANLIGAAMAVLS